MGYKFKPNKGVAKRFRVTATGKMKHRHELSSHLRSGRSEKKKRHLGRPSILAEGHARNLRRMLGQRVNGGLSRKYCGAGNLTTCRNTLLSALQEALTVPKESLYRDEGCDDGDQPCYDKIRFRAIGGMTVPPIRWINRPTFQQAVEVQGHR